MIRNPPVILLVSDTSVTGLYEASGADNDVLAKT
jgi:hypothetical protein